MPDSINNKTSEFMRNAQKVFKFYGKDFTNKEIAELLGIGEATSARIMQAIKLCDASATFQDFRNNVSPTNIANYSEQSFAYIWTIVKGCPPPKEERKVPEPNISAVMVPKESANENIYFTCVLKRMANIEELLTQLMDVVMPKQTERLMNAIEGQPTTSENIDTQTAQMMDCFKSLQSIICESIRLNLDRNFRDLGNQQKDIIYALNAIKGTVQKGACKK